MCFQKMSLLASVSNSLKVWSYADLNLNLVAECNFSDKNLELSCVTWNHNQQVVAVGGNSPNIYLVQASTGQILSSLPFKAEDTLVGGVSSLSFSHNSRYLASPNNSNAVIWDLKRRSIRTILEGHHSKITTLLFAPDGILLSGDESGNLRAWNVDRNTSTSDLNHKSTHSSMSSIQLSPSAKQFASGYNDGSITLWSMDSISPSGHISTLHGTGITSLSYSPKNEKLLASSGRDGNIHLTDVSSQSPSPAMSIRVSDIVNTISFHDSSIYISAGTQSGGLFLYDWRNPKKPVIDIPSYNHSPVRCIAFQKLMRSVSDSHSKQDSFSSPTKIQTLRDAEPQSVDLSFTPRTDPLITKDVSSAGPHPSKGEISFNSKSDFSEREMRISQECLLTENNRILGDQKSNTEADLRPVTHFELSEELLLLRYDIHQELHGILREQVRQFALAKVISIIIDDSPKLQKDMEEIVEKLTSKLDELLLENRQLRAENERLRHIY